MFLDQLLYASNLNASEPTAASEPDRLLARSHETATARARLREDLPDRDLEAGHDVSAMQNFGSGEGCDVGL